MGNFTIAKKMFIFTSVVLVTILVTAIFKVSSINEAEDNFTTFKNRTIIAKFHVLEIGKELNYISRSTRDIMLGNDYDKNIEILEKSRAKIVSFFDDLYKLAPDSKEKEFISEVKQTVLDFSDGGYKKMKL